MYILFFSSVNIFILLLPYCVMICLPPKAAITLVIEPDLAHFYFINIEFILLLNRIHLFVLELAVVLGFGLCMAGYVEYDYAIIAGMLGRK